MKRILHRLFLLMFIGFCHAGYAESLEECLPRFEQAALKAGVNAEVVHAVLPALSWQARVIELDRRQPEFVQTFAHYFERRVNTTRIDQGRRMLREHRELLRQLTQQYGIPGQYLVAFWGLETNFGSYLGRMPTLDSLATLACDPRRQRFFTTELVNALQLLERENLQPGEMRGSWAGAVGHTQFMPSSYLRYAVDGDGDGQINLWQSIPDALASGANFLEQLGWERNFRWGREVSLPEGFDFNSALNDPGKPLVQWRRLGIRMADGSSLPNIDVAARFLLPAGHLGPAFLVYNNFDVIMGWNRSEYYALSVGHLADRINGAGELRIRPPADQEPLDRIHVEAMQKALNSRGYDAGQVDGIFGSTTRRALAAFEREAGLIADGFPDASSIERLLKQNESDNVEHSD